MQKNTPLESVIDLWDEREAADLDSVARLVYRSNLLGSDRRITNSGGGNTSSKISDQDPISGQQLDVLWVKGSGGDLRTSKKENFSSLQMKKLFSLQELYFKFPVNGPKTEAEDVMVGMYPHCTFNLNPRASSIDTPLHAFIPHKHVDHMHPNAVIAIAASRHSREITKEVYGDEIIWLPWQRPGFDLGLKLQEACRLHPQAKGAVLGQHGLINWADDESACYHRTLEIIGRADRFIQKHDKMEKTFGGKLHESLQPEERRNVFVQVLPWLRGQLSQQRRIVSTNSG